MIRAKKKNREEKEGCVGERGEEREGKKSDCALLEL